jgi:RNA polymerase sigma factor (sigma-70 family)
MPAEFPDVTALKARDEAAWTQAFRHLWPKAWIAAQKASAGASREDVEEAASAALASLVELIGRINSAAELEAWTVVLASRQAADDSRKRLAAKRGQKVTASLETGGLLVCLENMAADGARLSERDLVELTLLLNEALSRLDPQTRTLLESNIFGGLTYTQLSEIHQLPVGTIAPKVARGLRKMQSSLRKTPELWQTLRDFLR